jgi:L-iditol 2-dehydrogenase
MPEACCYPIPDAMSTDQAVLSEPLAIGVYAVKQSVPMAGARIGILGAGPIGLSVLLPARAQGAAAIYVSDLLDYRLGAARRAGAAWAGNPGQADVVQAITEREPLLLDAVFECCGEQTAVDQAVDLLKPGGKLMLIGIPTTDRLAFTIDKARRKELCIQNVRRQNHCLQATLDLLAAGTIEADFMITHRVPFARTPAAFDQVEHYRDGVIKALVEMG